MRTRSGHPSESEPASPREHARFREADMAAGHPDSMSGSCVRGPFKVSRTNRTDTFSPYGVSACPVRLWIPRFQLATRRRPSSSCAGVASPTTIRRRRTGRPRCPRVEGLRPGPPAPFPGTRPADAIVARASQPVGGCARGRIPGAARACLGRWARPDRATPIRWGPGGPDPRRRGRRRGRRPGERGGWDPLEAQPEDVPRARRPRRHRRGGARLPHADDDRRGGGVGAKGRLYPAGVSGSADDCDARRQAGSMGCSLGFLVQAAEPRSGGQGQILRAIEVRGLTRPVAV
jgi:hypothetical protein